MEFGIGFVLGVAVVVLYNVIVNYYLN